MHLALATSQTERFEVACESQNERQLWARYIYLLQSRCPSSPLLQNAELWVSNMSSWSGDPVEVMGKRHALAEAILSGCTAVPDTARSKTDDDDTLPARRQAHETEAPSNITATYLQLLATTDWVSFVESRVQGWPGSMDGRPPLVEPFGLWWGGGDTITKANGTVTFTHMGTDDNGGIITSPVMEGVCFAVTLWPSLRPRLFPVLERLVRGFTAWMLAMKRNESDPAYPSTPLLARNLFPPDGAHYTTRGSPARPETTIVINTSRVRHSTAGEFSGTIHVPHSPYWGDLWVQAERSQDDIGHMFRAMALLVQDGGCLSTAHQPPRSLLSATKRMQTLFAAWSAEVEKDGWQIASLNQSLHRWQPTGGGGAFDFTMTDNAECCGPLALRLMRGVGEGNLKCGDCINPPEEAANALDPSLFDNDNKEIARSQHEAALAWALVQKRTGTVTALTQGFDRRLAFDFKHYNAGKYPKAWHLWDLTSLVIHGAALGVKLPTTAVEYVGLAFASTLGDFSAAPQAVQRAFRVLDADTPDGVYPYQPRIAPPPPPPQSAATEDKTGAGPCIECQVGMADGRGVKIEDLGVALGACASSWRSNSGQQLLDCEMVKRWQPPE
jgi:hypothetical protein